MSYQPYRCHLTWGCLKPVIKQKSLAFNRVIYDLTIVGYKDLGLLTAILQSTVTHDRQTANEYLIHDCE